MESKSRGRIRALSPIREMSGIGPVQVVPHSKGAKVMKGGSGHAPILVQALPPQVKVPKPDMKPIDRHYTGVDQVVSDYLHFARYGQVAPVLYGGGPGGGGGGLTCACCADRNRESVHKKLALQRGDDPSAVTPPSPPRDLPEHHAHTGTSGGGHTNRPTVRFQDGDTVSVSPTLHYPDSLRQTYRPQGGAGPPPHAQQTWTHYQPTPFAGTYLNPEYNRPYEREAAARGSEWLSPQQNGLYDRVLEADSKYSNSMNKLQAQLKNSFAMPAETVDDEYGD